MWYVLGNFRETLLPAIEPGMEARVNLVGYPGRTFHGVVQGIAWSVLSPSGQAAGLLPKIDPTLNWARLAQRIPVRIILDAIPARRPVSNGNDGGRHDHRLPAGRQTAERSGHAGRLRAMTTAPPAEAVIPPEDPALRFIRLELAPSRQRWIATLGFTGLALIGVLATVTFRIPYPVLVFAGILLLTVPPAHRPFRQAVEVTGAAFLGAGFAILLAVTTYDQPWLYLPLQCAALTVLLVLSRVTAARAAFILAALVLSFAEPAYLPDPQGAIDAALFNALALAGTAWAVAAATAPFAPPATREEAPVPPGRGELVGFALLALTAIGLQMLFYNTINLPEIRTGVIAVLLTADPDLRAVWRRMPLRQLCAASLRGARIADDRGRRASDGRSRLFCCARGDAAISPQAGSRMAARVSPLPPCRARSP